MSKLFISKLTLVAGLRADGNNNLEKPIISPRLAGMYILSDRYKLRGSWGAGISNAIIYG